jgi:hypothetical protein
MAFFCRREWLTCHDTAADVLSDAEHYALASELEGCAAGLYSGLSIESRDSKTARGDQNQRFHGSFSRLI